MLHGVTSLSVHLTTKPSLTEDLHIKFLKYQECFSFNPKFLFEFWKASGRKQLSRKSNLQIYNFHTFPKNKHVADSLVWSFAYEWNRNFFNIDFWFLFVCLFFWFFTSLILLHFITYFYLFINIFCQKESTHLSLIFYSLNEKVFSWTYWFSVVFSC